MAAPTVQTLDQVMAELAPGYQAQQDILAKKQAAVPGKYTATRTGLEAEKVQGFNTINNQATGRGMSFSGIPLDEQSTYLSTKYLPAVAKTFEDQNAEDLALQGEVAAIETDKRKTAMGRVDSQVQSLNAWNLQQAQLEAAARESALDRSASAANASAGRAASAPRAIDPSTAALGIISQAMGKDGFVSPSTFQLARDYFVKAGGSASDFATQFWKYTGAGNGQKNQKNWKSYYYG